jgi:16S rRNA (guanine527-N7)-methyltransferase
LSVDTTSSASVVSILEEAQARGFLGPGPVEAHVDLARDALPLLHPGDRAVDLGSGGGALGLPLVVLEPGLHWTLVESSLTRADFLVRAAARLDVPNSIQVVPQPAEVAGRALELRGAFDLVVARLFGPPATTAECAAPLLRVGGLLAVTEPPEPDEARWPVEGLTLLGLVIRGRVGVFQTFEQVSLCADRFPRRTGMPRKRPLF